MTICKNANKVPIVPRLWHQFNCLHLAFVQNEFECGYLHSKEAVLAFCLLSCWKNSANIRNIVPLSKMFKIHCYTIILIEDKI